MRSRTARECSISRALSFVGGSRKAANYPRGSPSPKWHASCNDPICRVIANVLRVKFLEMGGRPVTLLDGDIVRKHLSSELGFSKEHRDINIRRIGFVASEITKNGGIAICAPIAPYDSIRKEVRAMIQPYGGFILVHLSTPLETC